MDPLPTLSEIEAAKALIRPHIRETPTYRWPLLEAGLGCELWLKHENHTPVGAFKIRGGLVYMDELKRQQPDVGGVIAATTGTSSAWQMRSTAATWASVSGRATTSGVSR